MRKYCNTCGTDKDLSEFHKRAASRDGLSPKCKSCAKEYDDSRANCPVRAEKRGEYQRTSEGRDKSSAGKKRYIERNPKKRSAHIAVGNAIRDGRLSKGVCEVCGSSVVQGHHCDYNKPLEVMWLCVTHHNEWHKHNNPII